MATPPGDQVRPTSDRVKEAIFSILGDETAGAIVIDICAGAGGLGIEALSRGARFCTFVETDRACLDVLRKNLEHTRLGSYARTVPMGALDAVRTLARETGEPVTLIFADPPYADSTLATGLLRAIAESKLLAPGGTLVFERPLSADALPDVSGLAVLKDKTYGRTRLLVYRQDADAG